MVIGEEGGDRGLDFLFVGTRGAWDMLLVFCVCPSLRSSEKEN